MDVSNKDDLEDTSLEIPDDWMNFLKEELNTIKATNQRNLGEFLQLKDSIKQSPYFQIKNPVEGECFKMRQQYVEGLKGTIESSEKYKTRFEDVLLEITKLQLEIECNNKIRQEQEIQLKKLCEELETVKSTSLTQKKALNIAVKLYESRFGMKIVISEDQENCDIMDAIVYFSSKTEHFPIKFKIDCVQNKLTDIDASCVFSKDEENRMKAEQKALSNPMTLIGMLRQKVLSQLK